MNRFFFRFLRPGPLPLDRVIEGDSCFLESYLRYIAWHGVLTRATTALGSVLSKLLAI